MFGFSWIGVPGFLGFVRYWTDLVSEDIISNMEEEERAVPQSVSKRVMRSCRSFINDDHQLIIRSRSVDNGL